MDASQVMKVLSFSESDLQANRNGRISENQMARLREMERSTKTRTLLGCAGNSFLALLGIGGAVFFPLAGGEPKFDIGTIIFVVIFGVFWPLLWGTAAFSGLRRVFAKVEPILKKAEGPIVIEKTVRSSYNSDTHTTTHHNVYELRVGGYTFIVSPALENYMKRGDVYTIYFADFDHKEKSKEILSVELAAATSGVDASPSRLHEDAEVVEYIKKGDLMGAIRIYRTLHGSDFQEAKAVVEDIRSRM